MGSVGQIALVGALALAVYAAAASLTGVRARSPQLLASGQSAAIGVTVLLTAAVVMLVGAVATHDFSLRYVYDHSSRAMPADLLITTFYSGQEGSLLYWAWTLSLFSAIVLWQQRKPGPHRVFIPYVIAVLMGIEAFMAVLLGFVATPFERLPFTPPDGAGLNPLLYDDGMKIHPPMLLAGYMSWSVPFAFTVAALATGRLGNEWIAVTRRYAMVAWLILGLGNLLGAWWAYHVLGWGGYWGWDPVENVAIMPWLIGTAFIHSIQIQERRGMLKAWNVILILVAFFLSIFGTFVVRSGVLQSVHSFALSAIGPYFFVYLSVLILGSLGLFFWRLPQLRASNQLDSLLSREASFLLNNLLFLALTFAIFWGTIYPLVAQAITGTSVSVGPPYFEQVTPPLLGALMVLMGVAPLMPWRRASLANLRHNFRLPILGAAIAAVVIFLVGVHNPGALLGFTLCSFVASTVAQEFWRGMRARERATREGLPIALVNLVRRNNRRYGGYVVHVAMVLIGVGIVGSHTYQLQKVVTLQPGATVSIGSYTLSARGIDTYQVPGATVVEAPMELGSQMLRPQKVYFDNFQDQPSTKVAIQSTPVEDLYVVLSSWTGDGAAATTTVSVFINPLVSWIWFGGLVLLLGTFISLWPPPQPFARRVTVSASGSGAGAFA